MSEGFRTFALLPRTVRRDKGGGAHCVLIHLTHQGVIRALLCTHLGCVFNVFLI